MLKIIWEVDHVKLIRDLQRYGITDQKILNDIYSILKLECQYAFEAGRDFQKRYKEEEEEEK